MELRAEPGARWRMMEEMRSAMLTVGNGNTRDEAKWANDQEFKDAGCKDRLRRRSKVQQFEFMFPDGGNEYGNWQLGLSRGISRLREH